MGWSLPAKGPFYLSIATSCSHSLQRQLQIMRSAACNEFPKKVDLKKNISCPSSMMLTFANRALQPAGGLSRLGNSRCIVCLAMVGRAVLEAGGGEGLPEEGGSMLKLTVCSSDLQFHR
jgi:hypothetical protein